MSRPRRQLPALLALWAVALLAAGSVLWPRAPTPTAMDAGAVRLLQPSEVDPEYQRIPRIALDPSAQSWPEHIEGHVDRPRHAPFP